MKIIPILALSAFILTSCKNETASDNTPESTENVENIDANNHEGHDHEGHNHASETTNSTGETPKLNPPHGEPGHKCEIPVGAPLDGSAPTNATPQPSAPAAANGGTHFLNNGGQSVNTEDSNPFSVNNNNTPGKNEFKEMPKGQTPNMAPQQTAPGMKGKPNPEHGQPGHRCDVAVGQPLP